MVKTYILLFLCFSCFVSCSENNSKVEEESVSKRDLKEILKSGKLIVLAENSTTSFFIYRGKKLGFEYEILKEFASHLGIELEVKILRDFEEIKKINDNEGVDLVAGNLVVNRLDKDFLDYSIPFLRTEQILVQRKPENWENTPTHDWNHLLIHEPVELVNKKIYVRMNSVYHKRLIHLQDEIGDSIFIQAEPTDIGVEELIEKVSEGKIDYTIAPKNVVLSNEKFYDNIEGNVALSIRQNIAFGTRKNTRLLKAKLDQWLAEYVKKPEFRYLKHKYYEIDKMIEQNNSSYLSLSGGSISPFDDIFKKEAKKVAWDWTLLAAIAYQESKFNPYVTGFGGAYGMMQFMPEVGPKFGVYPNSSPEVQIAGGMKKIMKDFEMWPDVKDKNQRIKFALASYNAGFSHIKDAQNLAKKYGLNPYQWDEHVEMMVKNLSERKYYLDEVVQYGAMKGPHTQKYVRSVFSRYQSYQSVYGK
ncbi:MAG: transglycosylase SLT domain-containing protein [Flavobacteriia bacterium]|nr:transglycosylase SLT domain-containing protein [Flavobacteriia bacterium]